MDIFQSGSLSLNLHFAAVWDEWSSLGKELSWHISGNSDMEVRIHPHPLLNLWTGFDTQQRLKHVK